MRVVKDIVRSMENMFTSRSRRGYQILTRTFPQLQRGRGARTGSIVRQSPRSKNGGQR